MIKNIVTALMLVSSIATNVAAQETKEATADELGVYEAVEDYLYGLYDADSTRIIRSVDPSLRKIGYYYDADSGEYRDNLAMTYDQLVSLSSTWNSAGDKVDADTPRDILIYEVNDKSATAKLTAVWGIDYFHLAKIDGRWMIMNVLWQSAPR